MNTNTEEPGLPGAQDMTLAVLRSYPAHDYTLDGILRSRCALRADEPMLLEGECRTSWKEFAAQADALASALQARGGRAGTGGREAAARAAHPAEESAGGVMD